MKANDLMDNYPSETYARIRKDVEGENEARNTALQGIVSAYDKALKDPQFIAPTYLHMAIEGARKL